MTEILRPLLTQRVSTETDKDETFSRVFLLNGGIQPYYISGLAVNSMFSILPPYMIVLGTSNNTRYSILSPEFLPVVIMAEIVELLLRTERALCAWCSPCGDSVRCTPKIRKRLEFLARDCWRVRSDEG